EVCRPVPGYLVDVEGGSSLEGELERALAGDRIAGGRPVVRDLEAIVGICAGIGSAILGHGHGRRRLERVGNRAVPRLAALEPIGISAPGRARLGVIGEVGGPVAGGLIEIEGRSWLKRHDARALAGNRIAGAGGAAVV